MASRPKVRRKTKKRESRSIPISLRLERKLVEQVDSVAERFDVSRNNIVALILHEYMQERGATEVETLIARKSAAPDQGELLDIFS